MVVVGGADVVDVRLVASLDGVIVALFGDEPVVEPLVAVAVVLAVDRIPSGKQVRPEKPCLHSHCPVSTSQLVEFEPSSKQLHGVLHVASVASPRHLLDTHVSLA